SPQPHHEFAHRFAAELGEVAMGLEKRLLNDIRGADAGTEPVIELGRNEQFQIVRIEGEQLAQARAGAGPSRRKQLVGTMLRANGHAWSLRMSHHYGQGGPPVVTSKVRVF